MPALAHSPDLMRLLDAGGPVLWLLCAMSVLALALILGKWLQFTAAGIGRNQDVEAALAAWRGNDRTRALAILDASREPAAAVVGVAMRGAADTRVDDERVREEVVRQSVGLLERLRGGLRPLEMIAQLSPLLGLLGTVLGMIVAFQQLSVAGSQPDPAVLSNGIWQALLTTAAGLIVAIPALFAHAWLEARVDRFRIMIEDGATRVFTQPEPPAPRSADRMPEEEVRTARAY